MNIWRFIVAVTSFSRNLVKRISIEFDFCSAMEAKREIRLKLSIECCRNIGKNISIIQTTFNISNI